MVACDACIEADSTWNLRGSLTIRERRWPEEQFVVLYVQTATSVHITRWELESLRGTSDLDDGQVLASGMERDFERQSGTWATADKCPRFRARRTMCPPGSRFEPRAAVGWELAVVNLVGTTVRSTCLLWRSRLCGVQHDSSVVSGGVAVPDAT